MPVRKGEMVSDEDRAIGARLAAARASAGLSQRAAAALLPMSNGKPIPQSRIGKLETGSRRLLFSEALLLARVYGCSLEDLAPEPAAGGPDRPNEAG